MISSPRRQYSSAAAFLCIGLRTALERKYFIIGGRISYRFFGRSRLILVPGRRRDPQLISYSKF